MKKWIIVLVAVGMLAGFAMADVTPEQARDHMRAREWVDAEVAYATLLKTAEGDRVGYYMGQKGLAIQMQDRTGDALVVFEAMLELSEGQVTPAQIATAHYRIGMAIRTDNYDKAVGHLTEATNSEALGKQARAWASYHLSDISQKRLPTLTGQERHRVSQIEQDALVNLVRLSVYHDGIIRQQMRALQTRIDFNYVRQELGMRRAEFFQDLKDRHAIDIENQTNLQLLELIDSEAARG